MYLHYLCFVILTVLHQCLVAGVHDSYWTHACDVDEMNRILREKFVELYETPILENVNYLPSDTLLSYIPSRMLCNLIAYSLMCHILLENVGTIKSPFNNCPH